MKYRYIAQKTNKLKIMNNLEQQSAYLLLKQVLIDVNSSNPNWQQVIDKLYIIINSIKGLVK